MEKEQSNKERRVCNFLSNRIRPFKIRRSNCLLCLTINRVEDSKRQEMG